MSTLRPVPTMDWTLESFFPEFDGAEHRRFKSDLQQAMAELHGRLEALRRSFAPDTFPSWQDAIIALEDVERRMSHLRCYSDCLAAADTADERFRTEQAVVALFEAERAKLEAAVLAGLGAASTEHFESFVKREALNQADFGLRHWRDRSRHLMSPPEETLAAELEVDGIKAWSRLYDTIAGTLEFSIVDADGRRHHVPMSRRRSLLAHPERAFRALVFEGGNAAWREVAPSCAAALNAIAGARLTLAQRRQHSDFLEPALVQHRISRQTLDVLLDTLRRRADMGRNLLRRKAARIGVPALAWFDLDAPSPGAGPAAGGPTLDWAAGVEQVTMALARTYPALGGHLREMVARGWIDHSPRRNKRPGGFCTLSLLSGETRIFMTFDGTMSDVVTLAHEAGHAWHAQLLRGVRPLAQQVPMTLAECASTFAELLLADGVLEDPGIAPALKLQVLDSQARSAAAFLLDIPARFTFEHRFHEERAAGEVSVSRLGQLMVEAEREFFGDALSSGGEDDMFWASKLHFYLADLSFYNFPYTVGYLLSCALFARFKHEGAAFLPVYEAFLARTGATSCETAAREVLDADLESAEFWSDAIDSLVPIAARLDAMLPPIGAS